MIFVQTVILGVMSSKKAKQRRRELRKAKKVAKKRQVDKARHARTKSSGEISPLSPLSFMEDDMKILFATTPQEDFNITRDNYFDIEIEDGESIRFYFNNELTQEEALKLFEEGKPEDFPEASSESNRASSEEFSSKKLSWWKRIFYYILGFFGSLIITMSFPFQLVQKQDWHAIGKVLGYLLAVVLLPLSLLAGIILFIIMLTKADLIRARLDKAAEQEAEQATASEVEARSSAQD